MEQIRKNIRGDAEAVAAKRDPIEVEGLKFAVISFVAPVGARQRAKQIHVKIRGAFEDEEEARAHVKRLHNADPDFDLHIVQMYEWLPIPPPESLIDSVPMEYEQDKLNDIMDGYYRQRLSEKKKHDARFNKAKAKSERLLQESGGLI